MVKAESLHDGFDGVMRLGQGVMRLGDADCFMELAG